MNLEEWLTKYISSSLKNQEQAQRGIAEFREIFFGKKVYFWGAGIAVRHYLDLFENVGVPIEGLIDKKNHGKLVEGYCVLPPSAISAMNDQQNTIVIASTASMIIANSIAVNFKEMKVLVPPIVMGYRLFYPLQNLVCQYNLSIGKEPERFLCFYCKTVGSVCPLLLKNDYVTLDSIQYCISTVCTLKCKHCAEAVPYISNNRRSFVPVDTIKRDIKKITEVFNRIINLGVVGGETFLHPHIDEILGFAMERRNIDRVIINTNGTVIPNDLLCNVLKNPRIKLLLSDYSVQLKSSVLRKNIAMTAQKLKEYGVSFEQRKNLVWRDINSFESRSLSRRQMKKAYGSCESVRCRTIHDGILYPCPHYYAGVQTGKLPCAPNECLHIHDIPITELPEAILQLLNRPFVSACDRCMLPFDALEVPAAQQLKLETVS